MVKSKRAREAVEAEVEETPVVEQTEAPAKKRKRSDDEPASGDVKKKAKKDKKKDKKESRKEKKEKRKDLLDLPEDEADAEDQPEATEPEKMDVDKVAADESKKEKKDKKEKKKKEKKNKDTDDNAIEANDEVKKEKKDKKDKKKKNKTEEAQENGASKFSDEEKTAEDVDENAANEEQDGGKADRHIVFVGNLPYSATAASITAHFASLSPVSVRCLTKREDPTVCRGIAFVEFGKVWHMRTCLDKFHHSMFNDGISPARRINVELTAGGGGKTKQRKDKIKEKNKKLEENRAKRIERERVAKEENRSGGGQQQQQEQLQDNIHPSRRARVPGQKW